MKSIALLIIHLNTITKEIIKAPAQNVLFINLMRQHSENNPMPATHAARGNPYIVFNLMIGQVLEDK